MAGIIKPQELHMISATADDAKVAEERKERERKEKQKKELQEAFMSQDLHSEVKERVNAAVRRAAENGLHQIQVMTFPASYCNDGGRSINNLDPDWPQSLEGFAKRAFMFYKQEMQPLGYKLHCEIINFPGGLPGEVGMFLRWA